MNIKVIIKLLLKIIIFQKIVTSRLLNPFQKSFRADFPIFFSERLIFHKFYDKTL